VLAATTLVTVPEDPERLVARVVDAHERVDVLVNNAGQGLRVAIEDLDPADLRVVFELDMVAVVAGMQTVLPVMRSQAARSIVKMGSATSLRVLPGLGGYSATKATLNRVSVVYPAVTASEFPRPAACRPHGRRSPQHSA
jgi:short-subunit dehydrogenase